MEDFTTKSIESLQKGDIVLDVNLCPVKVLACNFTFLGKRELYSFGGNGPVFTWEHQFISGDRKTPVVVNLSALHQENPQLAEENVQEMNSSTKIMCLKNGTITDESIVLGKHADLPPKTKVYFIEVEGNGTYIVDNYVAKHELPNFSKWPLTFLSIGLTAQRIGIPEDNSFVTQNQILPFLVSSNIVKKETFF